MVKSYVRTFADRIQRAIARSDRLVRLAVLVRNQCRCIIKYHLAESPDVNETGEVWLRHALAPRCTYFVDVGANIGDWLQQIATAKFKDEYKAVAYEPSNSAFERLRERFADTQEVLLKNYALGDTAGEIGFFEEHNAGKGSSAVSGFMITRGFQRRVQVLRLDEEFASFGWPQIDLLKIDAEGYDLRVIRGARGLLSHQKIGAVQFEYNRSWQLAGDTLYGAMSLLQSYGYDVYLLKRDGLYKLDYKLYEEYFEYSNFVALSPRFADLKTEFRGII